MKHFSLVLILFLFSTTASVAQQSAADQPATAADIERYYAVMQTRERMKTMTDAMSKQMHQMVHESVKKAPALPPGTEEQMTEMMDKMMRDFSADDLLTAMVPVYQKHFTKGEIDAVIAFYTSPIGQKILKEMPAVTQEATEIATDSVRKFMDHAMQQLQEQLADIDKSGGSPNTKKSN